MKFLKDWLFLFKNFYKPDSKNFENKSYNGAACSTGDLVEHVMRKNK